MADYYKKAFNVFIEEFNIDRDLLEFLGVVMNTSYKKLINNFNKVEIKILILILLDLKKGIKKQRKIRKMKKYL